MKLPFTMWKWLARSGLRRSDCVRPEVAARLSDRALALWHVPADEAPVIAAADPSVIDLDSATPAGRWQPPGEADPQGATLATLGASGALATVLDTFAGPADAVVLLAPSSPLFARAATSRRLRVRWVPTRADVGRLRLDFDRLSRAMRGAKLVAVADPGNPLGLPLHADDADRLRWTAERSDVLLYVDESYRTRTPPPGDRLAELCPARTLVGRSHGRPTRRGSLDGPADLVRACERVQALVVPPLPPAGWHPPRPATGISPGDVADRLRALGFGVATPADGCFLWAEVGPHAATGREFATNLLMAEGVRVAPGDGFGPGGERFVRVSVAGDPGRVREGLNRLARFVGHTPTPPAPALPAARRDPAFSRG